MLIKYNVLKRSSFLHLAAKFRKTFQIISNWLDFSGLNFLTRSASPSVLLKTPAIACKAYKNAKRKVIKSRDVKALLNKERELRYTHHISKHNFFGNKKC